VTVFDKRLCEDGPVLIDISGMKDYEIVQEFSLRLPFFNQRGKEEWKWSQSPHEPRFSKTTEVGVLYFDGRRGNALECHSRSSAGRLQVMRLVGIGRGTTIYW